MAGESNPVKPYPYSSSVNLGIIYARISDLMGYQVYFEKVIYSVLMYRIM